VNEISHAFTDYGLQANSPKQLGCIRPPITCTSFHVGLCFLVRISAVNGMSSKSRADCVNPKSAKKPDQSPTKGDQSGFIIEKL
jgi:hypothetical protein